MTLPVNPLMDSARPTPVLTAARPGAAVAEQATRAGAAVDTPAEAVRQATPTELERAVQEVNAALQSFAVGLHFEVDSETDKLVVKVVDRDSGEIIRQIPSEETLRIAKMLGQASGLLLEQYA